MSPKTPSQVVWPTVSGELNKPGVSAQECMVCTYTRHRRPEDFTWETGHQSIWLWKATGITSRRHCELQTGTSQDHCQWPYNKGVCRLPLQRLNPVLLQRQHPGGAQGGMRHPDSRESGGTGLQLDVFRNRLHALNSCISSYLEKH